MKLYLVGGAVRDLLLGLESKDLDYVMVLEDISMSVEAGYLVMKTYMEKYGFQIFLETPEMFTIRAKFPKGHKNEGIVGDFVLARKEVGYIENTRRPILELGTLEDDLARRDFTVNAMAQDENGIIIDLFNGRLALQNKMLITPLDSRITMMDDPLRLIRAFRFSITKDFTISPRVWETIFMDSVISKLENVVSQERIREEISKMFKHDTIKTLRLFNEIDKCNPKLTEIIFGKNMWLKPTFEQNK